MLTAQTIINDYKIIQSSLDHQRNQRNSVKGKSCLFRSVFSKEGSKTFFYHETYKDARLFRYSNVGYDIWGRVQRHKTEKHIEKINNNGNWQPYKAKSGFYGEEDDL